MAEHICPFYFKYQGKEYCAVGQDCASKTPEEKSTCENTSAYFHKGITPDGIESMKKKIIWGLQKK